MTLMLASKNVFYAPTVRSDCQSVCSCARVQTDVMGQVTILESLVSDWAGRCGLRVARVCVRLGAWASIIELSTVLALCAYARVGGCAYAHVRERVRSSAHVQITILGSFVMGSCVCGTWKLGCVVARVCVCVCVCV